MFSSKFILISLIALFAEQVVATNSVTLVNSCSVTVTPQLQWLGGNATSQGTLAPGKTKNITIAADFWGSIFAGTTSSNGTATGALKAYFSISKNYYWIQNDSGFNYGIGISAAYKQSGTACQSIDCITNICDTAVYGVLPDFNINGTTSDPEVSQCAGTGTAYTVTFCPGELTTYAGTNTTATTTTKANSTAVATATGKAIHPNGNNNKCLDLGGNIQANGTPVDIYDCNNTTAQAWTFSKGTTSIQLAGTNLCVDVGSNPTSGSKAKVWQCYAGLAQQTFYYTGDNRFAVAGLGLCLDLTNGVQDNGNQMQVWSCTDNDNYQIWTS